MLLLLSEGMVPQMPGWPWPLGIVPLHPSALKNALCKHGTVRSTGDREESAEGQEVRGRRWQRRGRWEEIGDRGDVSDTRQKALKHARESDGGLEISV